jgi:hypothetical protein
LAEPAAVRAEDAASGVTLRVDQVDSTHVRMVVDQPRRTLPLLHFDPAPSRMRALVSAADARLRVRVCGAPIRGHAAWWPNRGEVVEMDLRSTAMFASGWHEAEPIGLGARVRRWSAAATATALLQLAGPPRSFQVGLEAAPAAPASRRPTLTLEVNGQLLVAQAMAAGGTAFYDWAVSRQHIREGLNVFRFHVPEVISPRSLGISEDARDLGFALTGLKLRKID